MQENKFGHAKRQTRPAPLVTFSGSKTAFSSRYDIFDV